MKILLLTPGAKLETGDRLSEEGVDQVTKRREGLGNPSFDLIIAAATERCQQTAALMAGREEEEALETLCADPGREPGKTICAVQTRIGDQPLNAHLATEAGVALMDYAATNVGAILDLIYGDYGAENTLLVVDSVLAQAIGAAITGDQLFGKLVLSPCEGFEIDLETHEVTLHQG